MKSADLLDRDNRKRQWEADCQKWRGKVLVGKYAHWCPCWDELPVDEATLEWPCGCYDQR